MRAKVSEKERKEETHWHNHVNFVYCAYVCAGLCVCSVCVWHWGVGRCLPLGAPVVDCWHIPESY